jgi:hypothetical protein
MIKEVAQHSLATAEPQEATARLRAQGVDRVGQGIPHVALDRSVAQLLRIQLRGVRRQPFDPVAGRVSGHKGLHYPGSVGLQPVPDDDQRPAHLPVEGAQGHDDLLAMNAADKMTRIEPGWAAQRRDQGRDARHFTPLTDPTEQRGMPDRGPGGGYPGPKRVTRLVHEDNGAPCAASPLFTRGQSRLSQERG